MEQNNKLEFIKFIISRYDHYYDSVNNKGNVYLTLLTFLFGGTITIFYTVCKEPGCSSILFSMLSLTVIIQLTGIFITLIAIKPFIKISTDTSSKSLIYFGDVANQTYIEYKQLYNSCDTQCNIDDAIYQTHQLANGLKNKYALLYYSTLAICIQLLLLAIIGILLINKL